MQFTYYGHSSFSITTNKGIKLLFDPFLTSNPLTTTDPAMIVADYILVSHAHHDHTENVIDIASRTNATIITIDELATYYAKQGLNVHAMNIGGEYNFPFGPVKLAHAQHTSSITIEGLPVYMGEPVGFMFTIDGLRFYYAGDTSNFGDMALFGKAQPIDYAILPIGDNYTMGPSAAASAAKRLQARHVIPVHYNTFPDIMQDPNKFASLLPDDVVTILKPDQTIDLA